MRFVIITGPSGAGKTLALHSFEDAGYYTADNLPPRLLPALIAFCRDAGWERGAVVIDARCGPALTELPAVVGALAEAATPVETLFLDAGDAVLVQRFKETRRPHPLIAAVGQGGIIEAIEAERALLQTARTLADRVLDTSALSGAQIRDAIHASYSRESRPGLQITITSFGFKHGLPIDADLVFDVRFLANPHYIPALKPLDGRHPDVAAYVHGDERARQFEAKMEDLVRFALPQYHREGKAYLNIAIGCTGGRHRSVVLAEDLMHTLAGDGYNVALRHRDLPGGTEPETSEFDDVEADPEIHAEPFPS